MHGKRYSGTFLRYRRNCVIMLTNMKTCKSCLIVDRVEGVVIGKDGACNYCSGQKHFGVMEDPAFRDAYDKKDVFYTELLDILKNSKGRDYDALVALSGGKDSTWLLKFVKEHSGGRVLAVTVDNGFESGIALSNIERVKKALGIDHLFIEEYTGVLLKAYRYLLTHNKDRNTVDILCRICTIVWQSALLKTAVKYGIPNVYIGYSPDQIEYYFFRITEKRLKENWFPREFFPEDMFSEEEKKLFWLGESEGGRPAVYFPFHVVPSYKSSRIRAEIAKAGLLPKGRSSQTLTNCRLNWLMMYRDYRNLGYNAHLPSFSHKIRRGIESRAEWNMSLFLAKIFIGNALFPRKLMKDALKKLGLDFSDLVKKR